jgi:hypothetical protein
MMKSKDFAKVLWIRISSTRSATYLLFLQLKPEDSYSIQPGLSEYKEVPPQELGVLVYDHKEIFIS